MTSLVGALAVRDGLAEPTGCVTELPALRSPAVPTFADLVFGGHDISVLRLVKKAEALAAGGVLPLPLVELVAGELAEMETQVLTVPTGPTQHDVADRVAADLTAFRDAHRLDELVVVNVSSTEALATPHPAHADLTALRAALQRPDPVLPNSSLFAYAAFTAGCGYVEFTPSTGPRLPALAELAEQAGAVYAGCDGKTGQTLLKSVLAPMFAMRHLQVQSWSGINLLGGGDGANLVEPGANAAKVASKQRVLAEILGYQPEGHNRIDYVADIGDLKTAWDLVTFSGFLGTRMRMEFSWHGCDSALAAPLVLDLVRLTAAAHAAGGRGPVPELGFFFKDPLGSGSHALADQWEQLRRLVAGWGDADAGVA
ncbi:MAG: inositol-3-phosphate synthase [Sporichthyaceae bacterium]|nr:inositol-3-phosphate synthase [Sporichthyaceae bacterium]